MSSPPGSHKRPRLAARQSGSRRFGRRETVQKSGRKSCQRSGLLSSAWRACAQVARACTARGRSLNCHKLAQWVEQRSHKPSVAGSTPVLVPTTLKKWTCVDRGGLCPAPRCPGGLTAGCDARFNQRGGRSRGSQRAYCPERLGSAASQALNARDGRQRGWRRDPGGPWYGRGPHLGPIFVVRTMRGEEKCLV